MNLREEALQKPESLIGRAWTFAQRAHKSQKRNSGEPYFTHCAATAQTLLDWHVDEVTVAAGLLHDTVEDTGVSLKELENLFGNEVAFLVNGVTKLGKIKYRGVEAQVENLRKMILAISEDIRVVFIKLADRLHNMRTLGSVPPAKQKRIALETDEIYAPLAYRLGMQHISGELQDLAFPFLYPKEYKWLVDAVKDRYEERLQYLERLKPAVEKLLEQNNIPATTIDFRAKRFSSLYKKLLRHGMDIEKIYDLVAMRIILPSVSDCYGALGIIHQQYPPLPGRIKDYIAMPKPNGYRSLHTSVIGPEGKIVEFQIRTSHMHEENENGIAAHWLYSQHKGTGVNKPYKPHELHWVQQLKQWQLDYADPTAPPEQVLESMKIDFFKDRIFAITPRGDVIDLPSGATPIDFAYQIHSDIGNSCTGAKVNGTFTPLDHRLVSGDVVEIIVQKNKKPSKDWLGFVTTVTAREHIKEALKKKELASRHRRQPSKTLLRIVVKERLGLIKDIATVINRSHIAISSLHTQNPAGSSYPIYKIECNTTNRQKVEKIILKLKSIKEIQDVSYQII